MADAQDIATQPFVTSLLAAGGMNLSTPQVTALPALITAASYEIQRICRRWFNVNTYDDVAAPFRGQPDKGQPDYVDLGSMPVLMGSVTRCASGRSTAMRVLNDGSTAQRALVEFTATGDPDVSLTRTGLILTQIASGVKTTYPFLFATYPTIQDLGAAVTALGHGWSTQVLEDYGKWPSVDLYGPFAPSSAIGMPGASLDVFGTDLAGYSLDYARGAVYLPSYRAPRTGSVDWLWGTAAEDETLYGAAGFRGSVRVTYQAGFATVPYPIQEACAEAVKAALWRLRTNDMLQSEHAKDYAYTMRAIIPGLPQAVREAMSSYRIV